MPEKIENMKEIPFTGTKVPINFILENEDGKNEEITLELDSQVFCLLCQEAMRRGIRVEEYILDSLLEYMEELDGNNN